MAANTNLAVAAHAMAVLGFTDELTNSEYIASSVNTNPVIVRKVLSKLVNAGLVYSIAGKNGGFGLNKPANKITLLEIMNAVEDISLFAVHSNPENKACPVSCGMKYKLNDIFTQIEHGVEKQLGRVKLSDILDDIN